MAHEARSERVAPAAGRAAAADERDPLDGLPEELLPVGLGLGLGLRTLAVAVALAVALTLTLTCRS